MVAAAARDVRLSRTGTFPSFPSFSDAWRDDDDQPLRLVRATLARGGSVLCHCAAGAHRGGTAGVALRMCLTAAEQDPAAAAGEKGRCDDADAAVVLVTSAAALEAVRAVRPIVEPVGDFADLLARLEAALAWRDR